MKKQLSASSYEAPVTSDFFHKPKSRKNPQPFVFDPPLDTSGKRIFTQKQFEADMVGNFMCFCVTFFVLCDLGLVALSVNETVVIVMVLLSFVMSIYMLISFIVAMLEARKIATLFSKGTLIEGQIVQANLRIVHRGTKYSARNAKELTLTYSFVSPKSGNPIQNTETIERQDIFDGYLPKIGRLIRVIYLNDKTYRVI